MEQTIYGYSLCATLALMIFFGVWFVVARKPDKPAFGNYIRSRRIMGAALLVLSANYAVHLLLHPRFTAPDAAILMNLSSYYISAWLFSSALTSLLDNHYITRRKFTLHIISWLCFTAAAGAVMILFPSGKSNTAGIIALTLWFLIYAFRLAGWIDRNGFTLPGLTIEDLAGALCTNRTYIAGYIKSVYHVTFREWIADLRIEYAKKMMSEHPEMTVGAISEASGFLSLSYFSRIFTEKESISPAKWKRTLA